MSGFIPFNAWVILAIPFLEVILGVDYTARVLARIASHLRLIDRLEDRCSRRSRWVVLPIGIGLLSSTTVSDWPLQARFHISRLALDAVATRLEGNADIDFEPQWLGGYYIEEIVPDGQGCYLFVTGLGRAYEKIGFEYQASSVPRRWHRCKRMTPKWSAARWQVYEASVTCF